MKSLSVDKRHPVINLSTENISILRRQIDEVDEQTVEPPRQADAHLAGDRHHTRRTHKHAHPAKQALR